MQAGDLTLVPPDLPEPEPSKPSLNESTSSEAETVSNASTSFSRNISKTSTPIKKRLKLIREWRTYEILELVGKGAFGVVFRGYLKSDPQTAVAIKQVKFDASFCNREVFILGLLNHPNCVRMIKHFVENSKDFGEKTMNIIMEYHPHNLDRAIHHLPKLSAYRLQCIRSYAYQLCLAVEHLHSKSICHRDIKPQNILIDFTGQKLVLGDMGSAKIIGDKASKSVAYVCSRFYRAPEMIVGDENYGLETDIWSLGCVLAEMWIGQPLFQGENSKDQFVKIMHVLGSPTQLDLENMAGNIEVDLPRVEGVGLTSALGPCDQLFADIVWQMLQYNPKRRLSAVDAKSHPFFVGFGGQKERIQQEKGSSGLIDCLRCD